MNSVIAERTRQIRDSRAVARSDRARETPDDEDRIERQIEHETETAIHDHDCYADLIEQCAGNVQFTDALHEIFSAFYELQNKPHSLPENRRLHKSVWYGVEGLAEAWEDVARLRVGEHVEKGESYLYQESGYE